MCHGSEQKGLGAKVFSNCQGHSWVTGSEIVSLWLVFPTDKLILLEINSESAAKDHVYLLYPLPQKRKKRVPDVGEGGRLVILAPFAGP